MQSKWKGNCKVCGKSWGVGAEISKINDHWCIDKNCISPEAESTTRKPQTPQQTTLTVDVKINKVKDIINALDREAKTVVYGSLTSEEIERFPKEIQKEMSIAKSVLFKGMVEIYKTV